MATALFILVTAVVGAAPNESKELPEPNAMYGIRPQIKKFIPDTALVRVYSEDPSLSYQHLVYKRRLDSLQRSVELTYKEHC